jgi:hypothetical protein
MDWFHHSAAEKEHDVSSSSLGVTSQTDEDESSEKTVSASETVAVNRLKLVVFVVLVTSAVGAALSVYFYLSGSERAAFEKAFTDDSSKILDAIGGSLDRLLGSLDGVAVQYVAHARTENQTWPFVTLPSFGLRMAKVLPLSEALILNVLPLVKTEQRADWEAYSVEQDYWVDETTAVQATWEDFYGPIVYGGQPNSVVQGDFGEIPRNTR